MVRPASCAGVSVQLPPPLLVPADRVASLGTLPRVIDSVSSSSLAPSASTSAALIESEIGVSSGPLAADTVRLGASACSASETVIEPVVEARLPPSLAVAVTDRDRKSVVEGKSVDLGGRRIIKKKNQMPPGLWVPADRVAWRGTLTRVIDSVSLSQVEEGVRDRGVMGVRECAVPLGPLAADTVRLGASACSASETVIEPVVEARLPPSLAVAVTDRVKLGSTGKAPVMTPAAICSRMPVPLSI